MPSPTGHRLGIISDTHGELVKRDGVLYVNPGSAGRQRAGLRATAALIEVKGKRLEARFIELFE